MDNFGKNQGKLFPRTSRGSTTEALLTLETTKLLLQIQTVGQEEENKV